MRSRGGPPAGPALISTVLLQADQLEVRLGDRAVIRGFSASFAPGTVTAVLGPNGCGKSTLLRTLAGLIRPSSGRVMIGGAPLGSLSPTERAARLAFIPQREEIAAGFTVREVTGFGVLAGDRSAMASRAIDRLGLGDLADRRVDALSEGQRQRVTLARMYAQTLGNAVVGRGEGGGVVLADEPAAALDPAFAVGALVLFRELAAMGRTVVVVLHDLNLAKRLTDRSILFTADGAARADGPSAEVIAPEHLEAVFGLPWTHAAADSGPSIVIPRLPDPTIR